jgi:hypothetical protein
MSLILGPHPKVEPDDSKVLIQHGKVVSPKGWNFFPGHDQTDTLFLPFSQSAPTSLATTDKKKKAAVEQIVTNNPRDIGSSIQTLPIP